MINPFHFLDLAKAKKAADYSGPARDPLAAVPVRSEIAEAKLDSRSCVQLRIRAQPGEGVASRLAFRLGFHRDVRVDLDHYGSLYWSLIDGRRSLADIDRQIRDEFGLKPADSQMATLQFTKMLMLRHLVFLDLGQAGDRMEPATRKAAAHAP